MLRCFSCKKKVNAGDWCYGCTRSVCVDCAERYGHMFDGAHGKRRVKRVKKK
jgi:hypothetical protein